MQRDYDNIPAELKEYPNWVCYGEDKTPINPRTGKGAKANDPATWTDYETAKAAAEKHGWGIGFEFSGTPYAGVDLDDCFDDCGISPTPEAQAIIDELDSYTEFSPSGNGIHIIVNVGDLSIKGKKNSTGNIEGMKKLEMYTEDRYFTMTGKVYE